MTRVFVNVRGQDDNLGDSGLRRGLLNAVRSDDYVLHVNVGGQSDGFIRGLGLTDDDVIYKSGDEWMSTLRQSSLRGGCGMLFNAGERNPSAGSALVSRTESLAALAARIRRRGSALTGLGVRQPRAIGRRDRLALRAFSVVSWRDPVSRDAAGVGVVNADWAFSLGGGHADIADSARSRLTLALRGDRVRLEAPQLDAIRALGDARSLQLTVVVQVEQDQEYAKTLARQLDADFVGWDTDDHAIHEERVRAIYGETDLMLSDRLHALVYAFTEGAIPVGISMISTEKVDRTFAGAGITDISVSKESLNADGLRQVAERLTARRGQFARARIDVRTNLDRFGHELRDLFAGRS